MDNDGYMIVRWKINDDNTVTFGTEFHGYVSPSILIGLLYHLIDSVERSFEEYEKKLRELSKVNL